MGRRRTKVIVTLGPATAAPQMLRAIRARSVDFVRTNMSHSSVEDLERSVAATREVGIPFIIDTEGSQIRTGDLEDEIVSFQEDAEVRLWSRPVVGNPTQLTLRPAVVLKQLEEGDLIHIDFDTLILRVSDTSTAGRGYVTARVVTGGHVGRNKAVVLDPALPRKIELPGLSEKDLDSIQLGLREGIGHIALSFVRNADVVEEVREATEGRMRIISKVECEEALERIDEIIESSDFLLLDRGDLSKEIAAERIPFVQKIVIHKARARGKGVFVATNLLETMIKRRTPTRAEVQDVVNTILDGAAGLTLAAETAIGKHPIECINMLNRLIEHAESVTGSGSGDGSLVAGLAASDYLVQTRGWPSLAAPHGGRLVNRLEGKPPEPERRDRLRTVTLDRYRQMELELLANGAYSPLEGFMGPEDLESVLGEMRLTDGTLWPLPIVLDVSSEEARGLSVGEELGLVDQRGRFLGLLGLKDVYPNDRVRIARMIYGTTDSRHPGVRLTMSSKPVLLAGRIKLLARRESETRQHELSPWQTRRLFQERGWQRILGVGTRRPIGGREARLQRAAMEQASCDGLFVHPLVGDRGPGGAGPAEMIRRCERAVKRCGPGNSVLVAAFATIYRYNGLRESLFAALCRKNFGCSHLLLHHNGAERKIFERFPDLGITIIEPQDVVRPGPARAARDTPAATENHGEKRHLRSA